MSRLGPIGRASRESEIQREARFNNKGLENVIVAAVANEVAHVDDFSKMPPRDPGEIVDLQTPLKNDGTTILVEPENPFADD